MALLIVSLGFACLWSYLSGKMMERRGRSVIAGRVWGFLGGLITMLIIKFMAPLPGSEMSRGIPTSTDLEVKELENQLRLRELQKQLTQEN